MFNEVFLDRAVIAVMSAIIGGVISLMILRYQGRRFELNSSIEAICTDIQEMESKSCQFWQLPEGHQDSDGMRIEIYGLSKRIGSRISLLGEDYWPFEYGVLDDLINFRQAATLDEVPGTLMLSLSDRTNLIQLRSNELQATLHRTRKSV